MDLPLCVISTILFSAAFQTINDTASLLLNTKGYSNAQISFIMLVRLLGKVFTGICFKYIIRKSGVFKSVIGAMIIFCESICIFWFMNSLGSIAIVTFIISIVFNFIFLNINSAIRSYGNSRFLVTYYSISQILSSLIFTFDIFEKLILALSISLLSLGCFLFRDLKKSQLDTNEKGEGAIFKVYFKYGKYFWASLLYSLSHWLINKYLLLSLIHMNIDTFQISRILIFLPLGRLCLNYIASKTMISLNPQSKIIISSLWTIITSSVFANIIQLKNWLVLVAVFCSGVFLNSKAFIMEYFIKNRRPEDHNISLQLTEQQIDSLSQFLVIILGSVLSSYGATGIFVTLLLLHTMVIFNFIF